MQVIVAKAAKRAIDNGKETVFFLGDAQISPEKMQNFKRRKTTTVLKEASPSAGKWENYDPVAAG